MDALNIIGDTDEKSTVVMCDNKDDLKLDDTSTSKRTAFVRPNLSRGRRPYDVTILGNTLCSLTIVSDKKNGIK